MAASHHSMTSACRPIARLQLAISSALTDPPNPCRVALADPKINVRAVRFPGVRQTM